MSQPTLTPAGGTVAGRPQPQTSAQPGGGPFVRHAPDGRRAQYVDTQTFGGFMSRPTVSMPGYCKGYRLLVNTSTVGTNAGTGPTIAADAPWNLFSLVQMKDAFGTQLIVGPGYEMLYLVPLYSGQFGTDEMRSPFASPQYQTINTTAAGSTVLGFSTYISFEFAKAYGAISGANAALLPVFQANLATAATLYTANAPSTSPTLQETLDSDFYWLPSAPVDPPGLGTTCQWIYQQATPQISATSTTSSSQLVQLPRLGGYLTVLILELRDSSGNRLTADTPVTTNGVAYGGTTAGNGWPARPKLLVDGVPLIDSLWGTLCEDLAISMQIGSVNTPLTSGSGGTNTGTTQTPRPSGTMAISRKTSLAQRDFGILDTGEIFLSTNPGTQIELAGYPWGYNNTTGSPTSMTLNAIVGQVVPTGALVQGLPEV
jgi:hypothetical protein